jgi:hypothetical protein
MLRRKKRSKLGRLLPKRFQRRSRLQRAKDALSTLVR